MHPCFFCFFFFTEPKQMKSWSIITKLTIPATDAGPAGRLASTAARARGREEGGREEVTFGFLKWKMWYCEKYAGKKKKQSWLMKRLISKSQNPVRKRLRRGDFSISEFFKWKNVILWNIYSQRLKYEFKNKKKGEGIG